MSMHTTVLHRNAIQQSSSRTKDVGAISDNQIVIVRDDKIVFVGALAGHVFEDNNFLFLQLNTFPSFDLLWAAYITSKDMHLCGM